MTRKEAAASCAEQGGDMTCAPPMPEGINASENAPSPVGVNCNHGKIVKEEWVGRNQHKSAYVASIQALSSP